MKPNLTRSTVSFLRLVACVFALCLSIGAVSARAAGTVTVNLAGATFGKGRNVSLNSGASSLPAAKSYSYSVIGTVHGTDALAAVLPPGTQVGALLDKIQPGSSSVLSGTLPNPNGTLPFRIINRTFSGSIPIPGLGNAVATVTVIARVTATGLVRFDITKVDFELPGLALDLGTVVFDNGSNLVVNAPPVLEFTAASVVVSEKVGTLTVRVRRRISIDGPVSVSYFSVPITATTLDYTPVSGVLNFATGETRKTFSVTIKNRLGEQPSRVFKLFLRSPTGGAFLGVNRKQKVTITDEQGSGGGGPG